MPNVEELMEGLLAEMKKAVPELELAEKVNRETVDMLTAKMKEGKVLETNKERTAHSYGVTCGACFVAEAALEAAIDTHPPILTFFEQVHIPRLIALLKRTENKSHAPNM